MRIGVGIGVALLVVGLAGCAPVVPQISVPPTPSVSPMFASDEEALAAAEEAYAAYLAVSNQVGQDGWGDASSFEDLERGEALAADLENAVELNRKGYRQVGVSSFDSMKVQQLDDLGEGHTSITVYVCLDVSGTDVIDTGGLSVVSPGRNSRIPLEVDLDDVATPGGLQLSRSEVWSGDSFC